MEQEKTTQPQTPPQPLNEPDTTGKRIKRGFKVLCAKIKNGYNWFYSTQFAKNIVEENTPNKNKPNPYATDLSAFN